VWSACTGHDVQTAARGANVGDDVLDVRFVRFDAVLDKANYAICLADIGALRCTDINYGALRVALWEELGALADLGVEGHQAEQQTYGQK